MLSKIHLASRTISLEAMTTEQVLTASVERLPEFITDVKNFLGDLFTFDGTGLTTVGANRDLIKTVSSFQYKDLEEVNVICPPGLKVDFLTYHDTLAQFAFGQMEQLVPQVLKPFNTWLAIVLTNPALLQNFRSDNSIKDLHLYDAEALIKRIDDCFDKKDSEVVVPFTKAYRNTTEFATVNGKIDDLLKQVIQVDQNEVGVIVKEISSRLELLMERMGQPGNDYRASGTTVKSISEIAYIIARECEMFSVFRYQVQAFATSIKDGNIALAEVLKNKVK